MQTHFVRPQKLEYPTIYYKFKALDIDNETLVEYHIKDFPLNRIEDGVKFMIDYFATEEPTFRARNIKLDEMAVKEGSQIWREILNEKISIACFKGNSDEIIAMSLLTVKTKFDEECDEFVENENKKVILIKFKKKLKGQKVQ
jgi:hypothetical protein